MGADSQEDHRYPFAGQANPKVKLGVIAINAPLEVKWLDLSVDGKDMYLARVDWLMNGCICAQLQNREQSELLLVIYDIDNGKRTTLVHEKSSVWINLHNLFFSFITPSSPLESHLPTSQEMMELESSSANVYYFIWGSESSGFMHLYLYELDMKTKFAKLLRPLTAGPWMVTSLVGVDIPRGLVYFHANKVSPLEQHLYVVDIQKPDAENPIQLTEESGHHTAVMDGECKFAVDIFSSTSAPPLAVVGTVSHSLTREKRVEFNKTCEFYDHNSNKSVQKQFDLLSLRPPEIFSFPSTTGDQTTLYGMVYTPDSKIHGPPPYPLIVSVYGGPHLQNVVNQWDRTTNDMRAQRFADKGFVVLKVDNRGSSGRGIRFEGAIKHCMGSVEVEDQVDGIKTLGLRGLVDASRVGIYGWSYGGYMSLMCLCKRPDVFHVAIAGAPVTSWDGYDTHYTERYMGTPKSNPGGYRNSSVLSHVHCLEGKLLLVHGLIDENVHFSHTARLINQLIAARKYYDLLLFPDERHAPRKIQDRIYIEHRILDYFETNLKGHATKKSKTT